MSARALRELRLGQEAIAVAIDSGDVEGAQVQVAAYTARVQHYVGQLDGRQAPDAELRELSARHEALLERMRQQHRQIGEALHKARRADSASRAYARTGATA